MKDLVAKSVSQFLGSTQYDVQEFMELLIDGLHEVNNTFLKDTC